MAERGYALDLTDFIEEWEYKVQINQDVLTPFNRDDRIYFLPYSGYVMGLFYNKNSKKQGLLTVKEKRQRLPPGMSLWKLPRN